jgi:hypothetical protein
VNISITGLSSYTLTAVNGAPDQARAPWIILYGTPSGPCTVTVPAVQKITTYCNSSTQPVILTTGTGTSFTLAPGCSAQTMCDSASIFQLVYTNQNIQSAPIYIPAPSASAATVAAPYSEVTNQNLLQVDSPSTATTYCINALGAILGTAFYATSDGRLKDDVRPIAAEDAGRLIDAAGPLARTFVMRGEGLPRPGFIAQDMARAGMPGVTFVADPDMEERIEEDGAVSPAGHRMLVDQTALIPYLVATVADLRRRLAALEG